MRNEQFGFPLPPEKIAALSSRVKQAADLK
jgi:hypothetical protein